MEFTFLGCQRNEFCSIFSQIRTVFEPVQGPCTMNVRNELFHDLAYVINGKTPSYGGGNFVSFNIQKAYQFQG